MTTCKKIMYDKSETFLTVYFILESDGEFYYLELDSSDIRYYFRNEPEVMESVNRMELLPEDAERFVNDPVNETTGFCEGMFDTLQEAIDAI